MKNDEINELNKKSYNRIAKEFSATRAYIWDDIKPLLKYVRDGDSVLDVGCGNGRLLDVLSERNVDYLGIDFSDGLVEQAKQKYPGNKFRVIDILNPFASGKKYDVVFLISALNHFPKGYQDQVLNNIKQVVKDNGYLLMINWDMWNFKARKSVWRTARLKGFKGLKTMWKGGNKAEPLFYYAFTKNELEGVLNKTGFSVVDSYYSKRGERVSRFKGSNIVVIAKNEVSDFVKAKSEIHGVGVFAQNDIREGEEFYEIPLDKIQYENYKRFAYIGNDQYVNDDTMLNWVNHSCNANTMIDVNRFDPVLRALRNIKKGQEITCNYDSTEVNGVFRKCSCGSLNCNNKFGKK